MRRLVLPLLLFSVFSCLSTGFAKTTIPSALKYQGKLIDPLCFNQHDNEKKTSLTTCGLAHQPSYAKTAENPYLVNKGFIGYEYSWNKDKNTSVARGFSYYHFLGTVENAYLLFALNNRGSDNVFSSLLLVRRAGDILDIRVLAAGDRCNNGIIYAHYARNLLTYKVNLSSIDLLEITHENPYHLKPYRDLNDCATCCVAKAIFTRDIQKHTETLISVKFNPEPEFAIDETAGKYQHCFEDLIGKYRSEGKGSLNLTELKLFIKTFNSRCVHPS